MAVSKLQSLFPPLGVGWRWPVRVSEGDRRAMHWVCDDEAVRQSIEIILRTEPGERVMRPTFGTHLGHLLFAPNNEQNRALAAFEIREALLQWEPRIEVRDVTVQAGGEQGELMLIEVDYRVRSTDNRFNHVFPYYLDRAST
jgi:uncharacterized protein